jgi:hypothetical protein
MREIQVTNLDPDNLDPENFCSNGLAVHPAAAMFPLMNDQEFEDFCDDIQAAGLNNPIVILGDILLDGRNRLRACAKVGIEPKFAAYNWYRDREHEWIISQNIHRRSLDEEQRAALVARIYDWHKRRRIAQLKRLDILRAQGERGKEGGRGHKKPPGLKSAPKVYRRLRQELAAQADVSDHKARQAVQVAQYAPELLDGVATKQVKLKDAAKAARAKSLPPPRPRAGRSGTWKSNAGG